MSNNKLRLEILNYATQAWSDVTTDVVGQIACTGIGMQAAPGQTSPRGNQVPAVGKCQFSLNNSAFGSLGAGGYNPSSSGLAWAGNKVRVRGSGASLGNCLQTYVTGCPDAANVSQNVVVAVAVNDVLTLQWDARSSGGTIYNTDFAWINTNAESQIYQRMTYTNKWATYSISFTATAIGTSITVNFMDDSAPGTNISAIERRNITLKKNGGANLLVNGNFSTGSLSPWVAANVASPTGWKLGDATLAVLGKTTRLQSAVVASNITATVQPDTWTCFYGEIDTVEPQPHKYTDKPTVDITALDMTTRTQDQSLNQAPQVNQTADQIMTLLYNQFPLGTFPGKMFDTGLQSFPFCFDGYTYGGAKGTKVFDAMRDTAMSEFGRVWIDRDGTMRFGNRQQLANAQTKTVKLTLADGMPFTSHIWTQRKMVNNEVIITVTPRLIGTSSTQLATLTTAVPIPPTALGGAGTPVTLTFVDGTGKVIGGANVNPPVFTINSKQDGSGTDYTYQTSQIYLQSTQTYASQVIYTFVNNTNNTLWITALTVSGSTVTTYNPIQRIVSDTTDQPRYGKITFDKSLPYCADPEFAYQLANYYLNQFKKPFIEVDHIQTQNESALGGVDILGVELFDIVKYSDVQSGQSNALHTVVSIDYVFDPGATDFIAQAKFTLEKLDANSYWILGDSTYSRLGTSTRLYL